MKPSEKLTHSLADLADLAGIIVAERRRPTEQKIARLDRLTFDLSEDAADLVEKACDAEEPLPLLLEAAKALQTQDLMDTAANLRGAATTRLRQRMDDLEKLHAPVSRLRYVAGVMTEQCTKRVMIATAGGNRGSVDVSLETHLRANQAEVQRVVTEIRRLFQDERVNEACDAVTEAVENMVEAAFSAVGV